ncbi:MAG: methyltransferase [Ruminococcus sp.]|nr:methyltransferase [Ruminococcus sp.]MBR4622823.1 methyltransferase [Ruminococcus sp.]
MIEGLTFEKLHDGIEIAISEEHRFGTDAFLLADFAAARHKDLVCDLCTGSGIVALLLYQNFKPKHIDAVEIQEEANELLKMSLDRSGIDVISPILCDLKNYRPEKPLDLITCNPPYKLEGTGIKNESEAASIARHELLCTIDDVCACAKRSLKFGGRLCLCNRPERLCDILTSMRHHGIEPKRVRFAAKTPEDAPWLVLVEGRCGGKPFLQVEKNLYTQGEDGGFSDEMKRIYRL